MRGRANPVSKFIRNGSNMKIPADVQYPFVSCLCPTFRRPQCLANAIQCFLNQDYPADRRELLILDDADQYDTDPQTWGFWPSPEARVRLFSQPNRARHLPLKFNQLANQAKGEVIAVWEDDDVYLPHHITAHVDALRHWGFSKPTSVLSLYTGKLVVENGHGRFHASMTFTKETMFRSGMWPDTAAADFDQKYIHALGKAAGGIADPAHVFFPSYIFRWASTNAPHGQALMKNSGDLIWYENYRNQPGLCFDRTAQLNAKFDDETEVIFRRSRSQPAQRNLLPIGAAPWYTSG